MAIFFKGMCNWLEIRLGPWILLEGDSRIRCFYCCGVYYRSKFRCNIMILQWFIKLRDWRRKDWDCHICCVKRASNRDADFLAKLSFGASSDFHHLDEVSPELQHILRLDAFGDGNGIGWCGVLILF